MLQKAPLRKSAPGPPTMSASYVSWTARAAWTACLQILPRKTTLERPKVVRTWCVLTILTSRCASPHNRVNFLDISTSKSGLRLSVFNTFVVEMCNSVHFFNINSQGRSKPAMFSINLLTSKCASRHSRVHYFNVSPRSGFNILTSKCALRHSRMRCLKFWLGSVLRATTACIFWTSQLSNVLRAWGVLACWLQNVLRTTAACAFWAAQFQKYPKHAVFWAFDFEICFAPQRRAFISVSKSAPKRKIKKLTSKGASRHSGVQFSISHTTRWLRSYSSTLRSHKTMEKTQCFATVLPTFLRTLMFFRLTLSLFWLFLFSVSLTVLTTSWTSKLPMITNSYASVACKRFIPSCSAIGQISIGARSPLLPGFGFIAYKAGWKVYTIEQNDTTHHSPTHPPKKCAFSGDPIWHRSNRSWPRWVLCPPSALCR